MSGKGWTPEPWETDIFGNVYILEADHDGNHRLRIGGFQRREDAERARVCVNACADIPNPEGLGELIRAFKNLIERAGEGEGMDISSEEAALRACGIEVEEAGE